MKHDRLQEIKQLLIRNKKLSTSELCERFGVSLETIRRDLNALERQGMLQKVYGGAVLADNNVMPESMAEWRARSRLCDNEKKLIAAKAIEFIPDNAIVALDSGTTAFRVSQLFGLRKELTILTNSLDIAMELSRLTTHLVYCVGGAVKSKEMITTGFLASDFLDRFSRIDIAMISADGVTLSGGITDYSVEMGTIKQKILEKSEKVICVVDHSKYDVDAFYKVCDLSRVNLLISDGRLPEKARSEIEGAGVRLVIA